MFFFAVFVSLIHANIAKQSHLLNRVIGEKYSPPVRVLLNDAYFQVGLH